MNAKDMAIRAAQALEGKQGEDILVLDVKHLTAITDYFVIASGRNNIQVRALADAVEEEMSRTGEGPRRMEGYLSGRWIVQDYGGVIVHMFHNEERAYYNLERLWMDGSNRVAWTPGEDRS